MLKLMFITNDPEIACEAQITGIDRIFVDLEQIGKKERQGHLDTVQSNHTIKDISKVRDVLKTSNLLVRINPIYEHSKNEIDEVISRGADIIMLPMSKTKEDVKTFIEYVNGRVKTNILLETTQGLARIDDFLDVAGIDEIHIGLNDMHLGMGLDFMFELISGGIIEYLSSKIKNKNINFGIGGMARIGQGTLPAECILGEHYRLGSQCVILSRTFHNRASNLTQLNETFSLQEEIDKIRIKEKEIFEWTHVDYMKNKIKVKESVNMIVGILRKRNL